MNDELMPFRKIGADRAELDKLCAARQLRERLVAVLETTADPAQLPSLFADIAILEEWIARLELGERDRNSGL